jgi:hypothetical protein
MTALIQNAMERYDYQFSSKPLEQEHMSYRDVKE